MKTIQANKNLPLPLRIFEISDVVFKDPSREVGARNQRQVCAVNYNKNSGFETVHGLLDRIMQLLEVPRVGSGDKNGYYLRSCDDLTYFPGRCAEVVAFGCAVGKIGVLHPETLAKFELALPSSALEINLETFL